MSQTDPPNGLRGEGVIEVLPDGFGFLRDPEHSFLPGPDDVYVSPSQIRRFSLRNGDCVSGVVRQPKENERYLALVKVEQVNGVDPDAAREKLAFEELTPQSADEAYVLATADPTTRALDLVAPLGRGQRGLVHAPTRSGRTRVLTAVVDGLAENHPATDRIVLLVGARPEDLEEVFGTVDAQVLGTTFDETPQRHVSVAEMALARAKRLVEHGRDVVLLVDSLNSLCRAQNHLGTGGPKTLPGGWEPSALTAARRLLGAARRVEEGGSLTVVASLVRSPDASAALLLEELGETTTWDLVLDAGLAARRSWPAIDVAASANHRLEEVVGEDHARRLEAWRSALDGEDPEALHRALATSADNASLLAEAARAGLDKRAAAGN